LQAGDDAVVSVLPQRIGVECRIQVVHQDDGCIVLLAGRLKAAQVHDLRGICAAVNGRIRIDLTDLLSADAVGIDALRRLRHDGAELVGVAQYLRRSLT
jgi:anti-anti-sigma regulatory factor